MNARRTGLQDSSTSGSSQSSARVEPNTLLKKFFESRDKAGVAEEYSASLSEKFFIVLDSFMGLVRFEQEH